MKPNKSNLYLVFSHHEQPEDLYIEVDKEYSTDVHVMYNGDGDRIEAFSEGELAQKWFTEVTRVEVMLVRSFSINNSTTHGFESGFQLQKEDIKRAGHGDAAYHLLTNKSLSHLQTKINEPGLVLNADQFRPNIVIDGIEPDEEDNIRELLDVDNNTIFRIVKHCVRWKTPTFNSKLKDYNESGEPLASLRTYKTIESLGSVFGVYLQADKECVIKVGDKIKYTKKLKNDIKFMKWETIDSD